MGLTTEAGGLGRTVGVVALGVVAALLGPSETRGMVDGQVSPVEWALRQEDRAGKTTPERFARRLEQEREAEAGRVRDLMSRPPGTEVLAAAFERKHPGLAIVQAAGPGPGAASGDGGSSAAPVTDPSPGGLGLRSVMSLVVAILCAGVLIRLFSRRDNRSSGRSRFTLLEVVIAFAILGMVSAGVFSSVLMARRMILAARCHKEADCLAADRAWELYNRDFDFLANYPSPVHETPPEFSVLARFNGVMRSVVYRHLDHCEIEVRVDWEHPTVEGRTSHARFSVLRYRTKR